MSLFGVVISRVRVMGVLKGISEGKEEVDMGRVANLLKQNIVKINEKVATPRLINYGFIKSL